MKLLIKTNLDYYTNHTSAYSGDSGIDLFCPETLVIPKKSLSNKIDFKIQCALLDQNTLLESYLLIPRSSMGVKTPLRLSNSIGLIDSNYRGNIMAYVDNLSEQTYVIEAGTRLFQLISPSLKSITVEVVSELPESKRTEGFGSSGTSIVSTTPTAKVVSELINIVGKPITVRNGKVEYIDRFN